MAERDEGALERAEGFFKRVLQRVGASVDEKLAAGDASRLPAAAVGGMASALEDAVEQRLRPDPRGVRRLAPDQFRVLLTYEQNARLTEAHRKALARELAAGVYEYINNHRYATLAPVFVEVGCDIFVDDVRVEAGFSPEPGETADGAVHQVRPTAAGGVRAPDAPGCDFQLVGEGGKPVIRIHLAPGGEPATVGRAAGNRIFIDHASVSKFHATIGMAGDGQILVADLGSTNGTTVNGEAAAISRPRAVAPGDTVTFGKVPFRIEKS
jgi:hypothetical protein